MVEGEFSPSQVNGEELGGRGGDMKRTMFFSVSDIVLTPSPLHSTLEFLRYWLLALLPSFVCL